MFIDYNSSNSFSSLLRNYNALSRHTKSQIHFKHHLALPAIGVQPVRIQVNRVLNLVAGCPQEQMSKQNF